MTDKTSEFGQGLTYCLGLFLAHEWNLKEMEKTYSKVGLNDWVSIWFNGASDHLYDLEIPDKLPCLNYKKMLLTADTGRVFLWVSEKLLSEML